MDKKYKVFAGVLVENGRAYQKGQIIEGLEINRAQQLINAGLIIDMDEVPVQATKDLKAEEKKVIEKPEEKKEALKPSDLLKKKKAK